ncbi:MAG: type I glutamate--ammonia ligase [Euryarchaeota archaeon]|nr:type I glutamate--ammonia ligase [Euryarchaeota archaeon]
MVRKDVETVLETIRKEKVRWLDFQFLDVPGYLQHITLPAHAVDASSFEDGIGKLDGSSIKGFKAIFESDMLLFPDPKTFAIIPWTQHKTARMLTDVREADGGPRFSRDPRYIAQRAEERVKKTGFDVSYWGPEAEYFVFDSVKLLPSALSPRDSWGGTGYQIESREAIWSQGGNNFPIRFKEGYYPAPPEDTLQDYRAEVCTLLEDHFDITIDAHHHEVATAGQIEIDMKYDTLVKMADNLVSYKFVAKNVAYLRNMIATFMPKPIFGDNASGMHVHQSLWKKGKNTFYDPDDDYAELSQSGRYYIGGLIEHARALAAIVSPTTNSYKRLVPGYEAPVYVAWSKRNRSACCRVPVYHKGSDVAAKAKRVEYRPPDTSCNPYFAFSAMVAAGLDGIKRKLDPGDPVDVNIYHLTPKQRRDKGIQELPGSLKMAIEELSSDRDFLEPIFPGDCIDTWIEMKAEEFTQNSLRPTPYEFYMYFDI